jgi:inner membrane protein
MTHALVGASLAQVLAPRTLRRRLTYAAAVAAMLPDLDVFGFRAGIAYGDLFGHRGITHSLAVACLGGLVAVYVWRRAGSRDRLLAGCCIAAAIASHGLLDALTNGGLGVAFFAPFSAARYFFPVAPIEVSPLGVSAIFSERGASVLMSEFVWVWWPALVIAALAILRRRRLS